MNRRVLIFVVLIAAFLVAASVLPVLEWLEAFLNWVKANPEISWLVFIVVYVLATVLLLPGSVLTLP